MGDSETVTFETPADSSGMQFNNLDPNKFDYLKLKNESASDFGGRMDISSTITVTE